MEQYLRVSFWGLNLGLGGMVVLNLFPSGVLQLLDATKNGFRMTPHLHYALVLF